MSRHTFSAHFATLGTPGASPHSFDFKHSLKVCFRDTGIFPFQPEVIRSPVDRGLVNHDSAQPTVLLRDGPTLQAVADILRVNENFDDTQVEASLNSLIGISAGHRSAAVTYTAAAGKVFATLKVRKQRRLKDSRLEIDKGRNLLEHEFMDALAEREKQKELAIVAKKVEKGSSRAPSSDVQVTEAVVPKKRRVSVPRKPRKAVKNSKKKTEFPHQLVVQYLCHTGRDFDFRLRFTFIFH